MSWFVLYTSARAEKRVEERLVQMGIECYLPIHIVKKKWSDRVKVVELPLFKSYIFVNCTEHKVRELLNIYGVARIVFYLGRPAVVRDNEIEAIREFLDIARNREIITNGDEVDIIAGPFETRSGKVIEVTDKWAKLYLEELGAKICVSLLELNKRKNGL